MDKIQIMTTCKTCGGVTYLASSVTTEEGNIHKTYQPCHTCRGSGTQIEWIELREFARLLSALQVGNSAPKNPYCVKLCQIVSKHRK
jgi:hypothetical protein